MYYGYRCYNKENQPVGWLYTFSNNIEITWTDENLDWCKRWKTKRGAEKHFDNYNSRWQFQLEGGYLQIEVMPEIPEPESIQSRHEKLLAEWGDDNIQEPYTTNFKFELIEGLPSKHGTYLFLLKDGSIKEGYLGSFPHPNHENDIRIANCEDEEFYYTKCVGWLKKVE